MRSLGTALLAPRLRLHGPNAGGPSSILGQGTRSHVLQLTPSTVKLKKKNYKKEYGEPKGSQKGGGSGIGDPLRWSRGWTRRFWRAWAFPDLCRTGAPATMITRGHRCHSGALNTLQHSSESSVCITLFNLHSKSRKRRLSSSPSYGWGDQITEKRSKLPKPATSQWWSSDWTLRLPGHEGISSIHAPALSFSLRVEELKLAPTSSHPKLLWCALAQR